MRLLIKSLLKNKIGKSLNSFSAIVFRNDFQWSKVMEIMPLNMLFGASCLIFHFLKNSVYHCREMSKDAWFRSSGEYHLILIKNCL